MNFVSLKASLAVPHPFFNSMKRLWNTLVRRAPRFWVLFCATLLLVSWAWAQSLGEATAEFSNAKANKSETPFGRLIADSLLSQGADAALVYAGTLRAGTLEAGPIERSDLEALFSFADDGVVTLQLQGSQLRAALERAASAYPVGSPAYLHCAGMKVVFNANAPSGKRIITARVGAKDLDDKAKYAVAMPVSLAEGAAGYFKIWNGAQAKPLDLNLLDCVANYIRDKKQVSPSQDVRFGPQ